MIKKIILVFVLIILFVFAYGGFVPFISPLLGADRVVDLGVESNESEYLIAFQKAGIRFEELPSNSNPKKSIAFSGRSSINASFTSEEITSLLNQNTWKYNPLPYSQVRFNEDGSVEIAGLLYVERLAGYTNALNIPTYSFGPFFSVFSYIPARPPLYSKFSPKVVEGKLQIKMHDFRVGKLGIPIKFIYGQNSALGRIIQEQILQSVAGIEIRSLSVEDGRVNFSGTLPDTISFTK